MVGDRANGSMVRVLIADDHPAVRAGLAGELAGPPDIEVVGQAADGKETLHATGQWRTSK